MERKEKKKSHLASEIVRINPNFKSRQCKERKTSKLSGKDDNEQTINQKLSNCNRVKEIVSISVRAYQQMKFLAQQEHLDKTL